MSSVPLCHTQYLGSGNAPCLPAWASAPALSTSPPFSGPAASFLSRSLLRGARPRSPGCRPLLRVPQSCWSRSLRKPLAHSHSILFQFVPSMLIVYLLSPLTDRPSLLHFANTFAEWPRCLSVPQAPPRELPGGHLATPWWGRADSSSPLGDPKLLTFPLPLAAARA